MNPVLGSAISRMSAPGIPWNPRIEKPPNPSPLSKSSASRAASGRLMCCQVPGRSMNFRSTIWTPRSAANSSTSAADVTPAAGALWDDSIWVKVSPPLGDDGLLDEEDLGVLGQRPQIVGH